MTTGIDVGQQNAMHWINQPRRTVISSDTTVIPKPAGNSTCPCNCWYIM